MLVQHHKLNHGRFLFTNIPSNSLFTDVPTIRRYDLQVTDSVLKSTANKITND
jgi:hypothetical protein